MGFVVLKDPVVGRVVVEFKQHVDFAEDLLHGLREFLPYSILMPLHRGPGVVDVFGVVNFLHRLDRPG
jgi:hypothetical protein